MPRPRRSFSPLWAGALIAAACARHAGARHAASPSRAQPVDVALHVTNHHWLDVTVSVERSEEHTSELQSHHDFVCRLLLEKKNQTFFLIIWFSLLLLQLLRHLFYSHLKLHRQRYILIV